MISAKTGTNPELLRAIRAEVTKIRVFITLSLSAGVGWCIQLAWGWETLGNTAALIFALFSFIVTPVRISGAISEEHARHTWGRQRMSALRPMQLMIGKAFGSVALTDMASLCALAFWGLGRWLEESTAEDMILPASGFFSEAMLLACLNLFMRFSSLALAIRNCERSDAKKTRSAIAAILFGGFVAIPALLVYNILPVKGAHWFGLFPLASGWFWILTGALFASLAAFWSWCAVRESLSDACFPLESLIVSTGISVWWAGTSWAVTAQKYPQSALQDTTVMLFLGLVGLAYLWGVVERASRQRTREFLSSPSLHKVPACVVILFLAFASALLHATTSLFAEAPSGTLTPEGFRSSLSTLSVFAFAGLAFRDIGILLLVLAGKIKKWPELATLSAWIVLGILAPEALAGMNIALGSFELHNLFSPVPMMASSEHEHVISLGDQVAGTLSVWMQACFVFAFLWVKYRGKNHVVKI